MYSNVCYAHNDLNVKLYRAHDVYTVPAFNTQKRLNHKKRHFPLDIEYNLIFVKSVEYYKQ